MSAREPCHCAALRARVEELEGVVGKLLAALDSQTVAPGQRSKFSLRVKMNMRAVRVALTPKPEQER